MTLNLITLQIPDKDLETRRVSQKVDPLTGELYTKDVYDPDKPKPAVSISAMIFIGVSVCVHLACVCICLYLFISCITEFTC